MVKGRIKERIGKHEGRATSIKESKVANEESERGKKGEGERMGERWKRKKRMNERRVHEGSPPS